MSSVERRLVKEHDLLTTWHVLFSQSLLRSGDVVGLFIYLLFAARRAVDELDDTDTSLPYNRSDEDISFAYNNYHDDERQETRPAEEMSEIVIPASSASRSHHTRVSSSIASRPSMGENSSGIPVYTRHPFERQDSTLPLILSTSVSAAKGGGRSERMSTSIDGHSLRERDDEDSQIARGVAENRFGRNESGGGKGGV